MNRPYKTALYLRLSRDDDLQGESNSISNQRLTLQRYAKEHCLSVVDEYVDDGFSGTNFDRPGFQRMISDIENGKVNCVVTKDLSRLGRNYIMTGQYIELFFPEHGVRYIAIDNNIDTNIQQSSEFAPFLNVFNEWYARDISRKIRTAFKAKYLEGAHIFTYAPLGYMKDPENKCHLLVDEETSWIIKKIYNLSLMGAGSSKIAKTLYNEKVPTPSWINYQKYGTFANVYENAPDDKRYRWSIPQVRKILSDETYLGHSVHNRETKVSYKSKKRVLAPKESWLIIKNTHAAIISEDVFNQVQKLVKQRRRSLRDGTNQLFSGLLKCSDCGCALVHNVSYKKVPYEFYRCRKYAVNASFCTTHYIRYDKLYDNVLSHLQQVISSVQENEVEFTNHLIERVSSGSDSKDYQISTLQGFQQRLKKIDNLLSKLYEDRLSEKITDRNFDMLSTKYQNEQTELIQKIERIIEYMNDKKKKADDVKEWISIIKSYTFPTKLTTELLNSLIEKIVVFDPVIGENGVPNQRIDIYYRGIGKF